MVHGEPPGRTYSLIGPYMKKYPISSLFPEDQSIIDLVIHSHAGQYRKTGEPFHMHPLRMYESYLCSGGSDPAIRRAILLHDIVEDTDMTLSDIGNTFGESIRGIIDALTGYDMQGNKLAKHTAIEKFILSGEKDYRPLIVKLFDCIDNLETIHGLAPEKQDRFRAEKRNIYTPIFTSLKDTIPECHRAIYTEKLEIMRLLLF